MREEHAWREHAEEGPVAAAAEQEQVALGLQHRGRHVVELTASTAARAKGRRRVMFRILESRAATKKCAQLLGCELTLEIFTQLSIYLRGREDSTKPRACGVVTVAVGHSATEPGPTCQLPGPA